jgi:hypothetical protein
MVTNTICKEQKKRGWWIDEQKNVLAISCFAFVGGLFDNLHTPYKKSQSVRTGPGDM